MGVLAAGDLEAAQRYHTTLGLIYVERGAWQNSANYSHSAEAQLTWALDQAAERQTREGFYQPLAELKLLLARGLDSLRPGSHSTEHFGEAARAFFDTDDLVAADSATRRAKAPELERLLRLRGTIARGGAEAVAVCTPARFEELGRLGTKDFSSRQGFKILADCARAATPDSGRRFAMAAFRLVDSAKATLIGNADVTRFERVMGLMLRPAGIAPRPTHVDFERDKTGPDIMVSLPGETRRLWLAASPDDVIAGRVVAALGAETKPFAFEVAAGVVLLPKSAKVAAGVPERIRKVAGVGQVVVP